MLSKRIFPAIILFMISTNSYSYVDYCYSVSKKAVIGFGYWNDFSRVCSSGEARYSIDGMSPGSPPHELIKAGLLSIKNQKIIDNLDSSKAEELAAAILAANRIKSVPDSVITKLLDEKDTLKECFYDFYTTIKEKEADKDSRTHYFKTFISDKVNCTVTTDATVQLSVSDSKDTVVLESDKPAISIAVADDEGAINVLTVPGGSVIGRCN